MKGDYGKMMKQFQKMQQEVSKVEEELADEKVEASSGGGMVKAVVSGKLELLEIKIDPEAIDPDDAEILEDMVMAAVNDALRQAQSMASQKLGRLTGGMGGLPGFS